MRDCQWPAPHLLTPFIPVLVSVQTVDTCAQIERARHGGHIPLTHLRALLRGPWVHHSSPRAPDRPSIAVAPFQSYVLAYGLGPLVGCGQASLGWAPCHLP